METKKLKLELNAADGAEGTFSATFSTLNTIDHHGDVTLPGAFQNGKSVLIGGYQHDMQAWPVGRGVIHADDSRAWVEGKFFNSDPGRVAYDTIREAASDIEWSYVFTVQDSSQGEFDAGGGAVPVRFLKSVDVWSVDPVLRGAGINTRTDFVKSLEREMPFTEHLAEFAAASKAFGIRVQKLAALRADENRTLSVASIEELQDIAESLKSVAAELERECKGRSSTNQHDLSHEYLRFQRTLASLSGLVA